MADRTRYWDRSVLEELRVFRDQICRAEREIQQGQEEMAVPQVHVPRTVMPREELQRFYQPDSIVSENARRQSRTFDYGAVEQRVAPQAYQLEPVRSQFGTSDHANIGRLLDESHRNMVAHLFQETDPVHLRWATVQCLALSADSLWGQNLALEVIQEYNPTLGLTLTYQLRLPGPAAAALLALGMAVGLTNMGEDAPHVQSYTRALMELGLHTELVVEALRWGDRLREARLGDGGMSLPPDQRPGHTVMLALLGQRNVQQHRTQPPMVVFDEAAAFFDSSYNRNWNFNVQSAGARPDKPWDEVGPLVEGKKWLDLANVALEAMAEELQSA